MLSFNWRSFIKWILISLLSFIVLVILFFQLFGFYRVYGDSMEPALKHGQMVMSLKWDQAPDVGDIILFHHGQNIFIKRVVALSGSTVEAKNQKLYINGKQAEEKYLAMKQPVQDFGPIKVPDGSVFVLGDEREGSYDSREMGPISKERIKGVLIAY
ncbi:signal peptidase I [Melghirimyces thermohalophilus]|uniref:Signal peptidase I n=1 Tax=Melghirimyces thermohalophilus TaxID=1236220 RepID=A0A1G6N8Z4_9BACL|nr:signal peptidase I [Melghirimyces thermohalophilus]SDC63847.1 signal peptidase I [Melghirimyces thermohalophilus]